MKLASGGAISYPISTALEGTRAVPGDKSMSHRALLFGAIANGSTQVHGLLEGEDVLRTAAAMRTLGADIECDRQESGNVWQIVERPTDIEQSAPANLYFGNAGTGVRLAMGLVAGLGLAATFDGDASLRSRPMGRIVDPLLRMGVVAQTSNEKLPIRVLSGPALKGIRYRLPVPSAQVKSAILLAGLQTDGTTIVEEPVRTRDHTENMLRAFGVEMQIDDGPSGRLIEMQGNQKLQGTKITIPGDPSSAAFIIAAALITPGSDVTIQNVMMNPLRTGILKTFEEMGGVLEYRNQRTEGGELVADINVRSSKLKGVVVPPDRAPAMIDEYPILSVVAAYAQGETVMEGIGEMRVKESDRIAACEAGLRSNGVSVDVGKDWMKVVGGQTGSNGHGPNGGGTVSTDHDHRIAMSFLLLGLRAQNPIAVDDISMIATSFPNFITLMNGLGAKIELS